jgi:CRP-like cAMP-binding protein
MFDAMSPAIRNKVLLSIPQETLERWKPHLDLIEAPLGMRLYRSDEPIKHVYFPESSLASIVASTSNGQTCEVGIVGFEGGAGLQVVMGARSSPHESFIQIPGGIYRLPASVIRKEFKENPAAHDCILSFVNKFLIQVSQTTLCNRLHSVDERLARWLLMCDDRIVKDKIGLTQELLAVMLGVTRVSVTIAASALQASGHIKYARGNITIIDREALERLACECYQVVKTAYDVPDEVETECDDE